MNNDDLTMLELKIEAFLAGDLSSAERADFEAMLAADDELRRQVELQKAADESLRRVYVPVAVALPPSVTMQMSDSPLKLVGGAESGTGAGNAAAVGGAAKNAGGGSFLTQPLKLTAKTAWIGIAAAVVLAAVTWYSTRPPAPVFQQLTPETIYARMEARDFAPEVVCTTSEDFYAFMMKRFRQPMVPATVANVQLLGWGYSDAYSGSMLSLNAVVLLAKAEGEPVVVVMDRRSEDRGVKLDPASGLNLFRRELGSVVLYEITKRKSADVIESLKIPPK
jgi:hypothetical protein